MKHYAVLEAGGTKMVMGLLDKDLNILERVSIPTRAPEETMKDMLAFFRPRSPAALGIGCFGPIDLNPASPAYGTITQTPKLSWRNYPILRVFERELGIPVRIDTDVNGAALAEARLGAARGLDSCLYLTVGTGIGGGLILKGEPVHGLMHPEIGHMLIAPAKEDPCPEGFCPSHRHCAEGLASGPAIQKRWGVPAAELPQDHPAWALEAHYLAQVCANAMLSFSPEKIILGGGVMHQSFLFPMIRRETLSLLGGYLPTPPGDPELENYIVPTGLGDNSGMLGAGLMALTAEETV